MERTAYRSSAAASGSEKWYYVDGGKKCGPIDAAQLASKIASGALDPDTRVWTKGMDKWGPASETDLMDRVDDPKQTPVVVSLNTAEQPAPRKKSRWWIWLIVGILVVGILAAGAYFLFFRKEAPETPEEVEVITYGLEDPLIFENEECAFFIDAVGEKGDYLELDVRCVNKTEEVLSFTWESTCVNGNMFDPLWDVTVLGKTTMRSSITFPLSTLDSYNLLPVEQIKFVLRVYEEYTYSQIWAESSPYIIPLEAVLDESLYEDYKKVKGYDGYLFAEDVKTDKDGRPYYVNEEKESVYFDEIYDLNGQPLYPVIPGKVGYTGFYDDKFGRPYYFSGYGNTVYYDGYGFAFTDEETGKNYFYDEDGNPAYYGNDGVPEYYEGTVSQAMLDAGKPENLEIAGEFYTVHKEFAIYPTGKDATGVEYPNRIFATTEQVYWNGEKGSFIVLGGTMDEFKGYIVHTYIENNSDSYIYFGWNGVVVNGVITYPDSITVLRPHSRAYRDIVIPAGVLEDNKIKEVEQIDFSVYAAGENLSVPLYPIAWEAVAIAGVTD